MGTASYMSPEQVRRHPVDARTAVSYTHLDVYKRQASNRTSFAAKRNCSICCKLNFSVSCTLIIHLQHALSLQAHLVLETSPLLQAHLALEKTRS